MSADAELLRSLCLAPGPTGFEAPVQEVVRRRLAPLGEMQADPLGNLCLDVGPAGGPQVVVTAHADQIGLIVTDGDELMAAGSAATLSLSLPIRYMHSPFEVAHVNDLEAAARLVAALARRVGESGAPESFVPRT